MSRLLQLGVFRIYFPPALVVPSKINAGDRIRKLSVCVVSSCRLHSPFDSMAWLGFEREICSQTEGRSNPNARRVPSCSKFVVDRSNCNRCSKLAASRVVRTIVKNNFYCGKFGNRVNRITFIFGSTSFMFILKVWLVSAKAFCNKSINTTQLKCKIPLIQLKSTSSASSI